MVDIDPRLHAVAAELAAKRYTDVVSPDGRHRTSNSDNRMLGTKYGAVLLQQLVDERGITIEQIEGTSLAEGVNDLERLNVQFAHAGLQLQIKGGQ